MTLVVLALLSLAALPLLAQAPDHQAAVTVTATESLPSSPSNTEEPAPEADACPSTQELLGTPLAPIEVSLPSCSAYNGTYCSTPTTKVRCLWAPYEPGLCVCQYSHVWLCG
jgi:hypothetical protein